MIDKGTFKYCRDMQRISNLILAIKSPLSLMEIPLPWVINATHNVTRVAKQFVCLRKEKKENVEMGRKRRLMYHDGLGYTPLVRSARGRRFAFQFVRTRAAIAQQLRGVEGLATQAQMWSPFRSTAEDPRGAKVGSQFARGLVGVYHRRAWIEARCARP